MLSAARIVAAVFATAMLGALAVITSAAPASGDVTCPPKRPFCVIVVKHPPSPSPSGTSIGSASGSSQRVCRAASGERVVPCYVDGFGWWSHADECYYQRVDPQPPETVPEWRGHYPDGAIYQGTCPGGGGTGGGWVWFQDPPDGYGGGGATPAEVALQAVKLLPISSPDIGMAPEPGKTGLVGLPVWMWTSVSARTWGPARATASVPGLSVTATAEATKVVWDMGDGHSVTCASPGTPYTRSQGSGMSPNCGYRYERSSAQQQGAAYTVTATTTWAVTWVGGGESGALTVTRSSTAQVRIGELQVLVS